MRPFWRRKQVEPSARVMCDEWLEWLRLSARIAWATGKSIQEVVDDITSMDVSNPTAIGGLDAEGN